jgi:hypothetical protein
MKHITGVLVCLGLLLGLRPAQAADAFDYYTNPVLNKLVETPTTQELKELTPDQVADHDRVLTNLPFTFLVVKTNQGRRCKLLVQMARQKVADDKFVRLLMIDRYVTYREGEEQTIQTSARNLSLFGGFRLSLDLGQVVPEEVGGDIRLAVEGDKVTLQPVGKAKLYLVTKELPNLAPPKGEKLVVGENFDPRFFNGTYKLHDDGRRSGKLILKVDEELNVVGSFYSDRDGAKYEVRGKVGMPTHTVQFTIQLPRTEQTYIGWLFTGDAKALTGFSRLANRETGFYAVRVED